MRLYVDASRQKPVNISGEKEQTVIKYEDIQFEEQ